MGNIQDLLAQILSARYGRDVRQSIHDAIKTCYEDGHAGAIDLQARELLGDTDISGISETVTGAVVELGGAVETANTAMSTAERAEGKADDAVTAAESAEEKADDALEGLAAKQKALNNGAYTGNIDDLFNNPDYNGYYFINNVTASGTQPTTGFYMLLVFGSLQLAVTTNAATVYFFARTYINGAWSYWRKVQLTQ